MSEIKTGMTVRLKSGGPIMTVGKLTVDVVYRCHWFDSEDCYQVAELSSLTLTEVHLKAEPND